MTRTGRFTLSLFMLGFLFGCPAGPQVKATDPALGADAMPTDPQQLVTLSDQQFALGSSGVETSRVALSRALSKNPDWASSKDAFNAYWRLARADSELAAVDDKTKKAAMSEAGIAAGKKAIELEPGRVEGPYYLAQLIGYSAQINKGDKALIAQMVGLAEQADKIDPSFDHAGPARVLGALYARAPQPPLSVGDSGKAVQLLQRAVQGDPGFPGNTVYLAEALLADEQFPAAAAAIKSARQMLSDPRWDRYRDTWTRELDKTERKLKAKTG
jgi:hypothetical protein